nr:MAG TPA: hypothetical protein [Caudoviricetes sp.]
MEQSGRGLPVASRCANRGLGRERPKPPRRTFRTFGLPTATRADR